LGGFERKVLRRKIGGLKEMKIRESDKIRY